jgi:hypothetical protein
VSALLHLSTDADPSGKDGLSSSTRSARPSGLSHVQGVRERARCSLEDGAVMPSCDTGRDRVVRRLPNKAGYGDRLRAALWALLLDGEGAHAAKRAAGVS